MPWRGWAGLHFVVWSARCKKTEKEFNFKVLLFLRSNVGALQTSASALTYKKVKKHIFLEEFMHLIANFSFFCKLLIKT